MTLSPEDFACAHLATPQEQHRDPDYQACNAAPGEPCRWARRHDGELNPTFHSERLEQLLDERKTPFDPPLLAAPLLETGLV